MAPRRRCPTCGSRQWHKEPHSGLIACEEGHVLQNYRNEINDAEEFGPHSLKKRTLKSKRTKKGRGSQANPELYHGVRARYHYFECLQLLLRKQIAILIDVWKLPSEFEIVCKDLWAMNLELLPDPLPSDVHLSTLGDDQEHTGPKATGSGTSQPSKSQETSSGVSSDDDDEADKGSENEESDLEMEALLRENEESEDSSEDDAQPADTTGEALRRPGVKKARGHELFESPASLIALLMIGCWTLRVPVLCRDFGQLIEEYRLPYLDPVTRGLLPDSMVLHLNKHIISSLSPRHAPRTQVVHGIASRLCKHMYRTYGVFVPEVNASPVLWRVISDALCGTPTLYRLTKRVGQILSFPLTLHFVSAPGLEKLKNYDPDRHIYDNAPPEAAFLSAGIVVLKMIYGLDGQTRIPKDDTDAACSLPRVEDFLQRLQMTEDEDRGSSRNAMFDSRRNNLCMGDLTDPEVDEYLEFSEGVLISKPSGDGLLERYFPLRTSRRSGLEASVHPDAAKARMDVKAVVSSTTTSSSLRPGEGYRIYRSRDVDGTLPETLQKVIERAAEWAGVDEEFLGGIIETYERRILGFQTKRKM